MMKADHPAAFRFLYRDELYLLAADKAAPATERVERAGVANVTEEPPSPKPTIDTSPANVTSAIIPAAVTAEPEPTTDQPIPPIQTPASPFNYLGKNNKQFLILVHYTGEEFIEPSHRVALENILKRKGYDADDVAILNLHSYAKSTMRELYKFFRPVKLLVLGENAIPEGLGAVELNRLRQEKSINILYSYSFEEMMDSNEYKKAFWDQMKTL